MQVFEDISSEALEVCLASLLNATGSVEKALSRLDGKLFLLKHLSYLRHELQRTFENTAFVQKVPMLELEEVLNTAMNIVVERNFNVGALSDLGKEFVAATSAPHVIHQRLDARQVSLSFSSISRLLKHTEH